MIANGFFSPGSRDLYRPLYDALLVENDRYMVLADYASYMECQGHVSELYRDSAAWVRAAITNVAHMGRFSSDRTIREYARDIWHVPVMPAAEPRI